MTPYQISKPSSRRAGLPQLLSIALPRSHTAGSRLVPCSSKSYRQCCWHANQLHKSPEIHVSHVILWASVTHTKLDNVQKPRAALPETWLLPRVCLVPLPTCPRVFTSTGGLHILYKDIRRGDKPTFLALAWLIYPRCESTELCVEGGWPSTSIRADTLHLCLLYNYTWNHRARI